MDQTETMLPDQIVSIEPPQIFEYVGDVVILPTATNDTGSKVEQFLDSMKLRTHQYVFRTLTYNT